MTQPRIGLTADCDTERYMSRRPYADRVRAAGGLPLILPCLPDAARAFLEVCDAVILTGGDDPIMETFGTPTHPKATPVDPARQAFELALLTALDEAPEIPVLGICLGMQYMALHAGGTLAQHLPETLATHEAHWGGRRHAVRGALGEGEVHSHHRQAIEDAGALEVIATAPDGVIEAVRHPQRRHYLGVQWHPERSGDGRLGLDLVRDLVEAARRRSRRGV